MLDLHDRAGEKEKHPFRGWLCFASDYVLRGVTWAVLLGVVVVVAWKTLSPLPWED